jgi:hypothetical protein
VQARDIGVQFNRLEIPFTVALSSPYCRTRETAGLAFGVYEVNAILQQQLATDAAQTAASMTTLLQMQPPEGTNLPLITHSTNLTVTGLPFIQEGDCLVLRPGGDSWEVIALVPAAEWAAFD